MRPYLELKDKYMSDAPFNQLVRTLRALIEEHGFMPSEIREGMFLAQYQYESNQVKMLIKTEKEWEQLRLARDILKFEFAKIGLSDIKPQAEAEGET